MKRQRVRDPVHNLIEFGLDELEQNLWQAIQTRPFQRLRRVRQLGFSELVFPGATHTRFAHSIGVFHVARQLMSVVRRHLGSDFKNSKSNLALAAALLHDVGHGMFSHAFEGIGKELGLPMANHETVSERLIRDSEISEVLKQLGSGFADDVADILRRKSPNSLYDAVVSSQFDADRLDYMQRDRFMTGVQISAIDATWLMANLEVESIAASADDEKSGNVDTLVLGPKAFHAAENYVLYLFQLYPNVYLHKTTRGAERLFSRLMIRFIELERNEDVDLTGLPPSHPLSRFALEPNSLDHALALDDAVFWGALPLLANARDRLVGDYASRLIERRLPKCIDIRKYAESQDPVKSGMSKEDRQARDARVKLKCKEIETKIKDFDQGRSEHEIFLDVAQRSPYKRFQDSGTPLNQISIRQHENQCEDMAHLSTVVSSAQAFDVCRAYYIDDDTEGKAMIENITRTF